MEMDELKADLQFCVERKALAQLAANLAASKGHLSDVGEWLDSVDGWDDLIDTLTTEINRGLQNDSGTRRFGRRRRLHCAG
mgnify:CR=1 FL=1